MDRISNLPDGILIHILSSISTDEAASTSLLSKRWRNLFAFSPNLQFSSHKSGCRQNFMDFVDRVLAVSGNSPIRRFTLKCGFGIDSAHTNRWISNVLNRGVYDLDLDLTVLQPLLFDVFVCKTLVELKVRSRLEILLIPEDVSLPALKTLSLSLVQFCDLGAFEKLISACPLLEELKMDGIDLELWKCSQILSGLNLKRLTIICYNVELESMCFDYPNLIYLEYSSFIQHQYPLVNLRSLVEAKIDISMLEGDPHICDPTNLIKGLRNVERLNLFSPETLQVFGTFHEAIPVFENLSHLSITSEVEFCFSVSSLPSLLKKSPNLKTLVIEGPLTHRDPLSFCECFTGCSCTVKVLELTVYKGSSKELEKIKCLLVDLSCLELLKVCASAEKAEDRLRLTTDLLMLPRASTKCKIQVEFS